MGRLPEVTPDQSPDDEPLYYTGKTFDELIEASTTEDGAIDLAKMEEAGRGGGLGRTNSGRVCDVVTGPCACGAWH